MIYFLLLFFFSILFFLDLLQIKIRLILSLTNRLDLADQESTDWYCNHMCISIHTTEPPPTHSSSTLSLQNYCL